MSCLELTIVSCLLVTEFEEVKYRVWADCQYSESVPFLFKLYVLPTESLWKDNIGFG